MTSVLETGSASRPLRRSRVDRALLLALGAVAAGALACSSSGGAAQGAPGGGGSLGLGPDLPASGSGGGPAALPGDRPGGGGGSAETPSPDLPLEPIDASGGEEPAQMPSLMGAVSFSVPSQAYEGQLSVELSTQTPSAQIRYTTDGSLPHAGSPLYAGDPLSFSDTVQLRAQAFVDGEPSGEPSTALYVARTFDAVSDLPLIIVDGYGGGKPEDRDVFADMAFLVFEAGAATSALSNLPTLATRAGYHLRGQSSASFDKAPYRVELWDNDSEDADYPLLGMPAEADWALIGPFADRSLIRHAFAYDLGPALGLLAPRFAFAEVYVNYEDRPLEASDYQGVYMVVETIKNQKNRIDLRQLREDDTDESEISGGYIFKFDWAAAEEPTLDCSGSAPLSGGFGFPGGQNQNGGTCWNDLEVVDPVPLAPEQAAFLTGYLQAFHDSLHSAPMSEYGELIHVDSFVDFFIVNELSRDIDAYTRSAYYHKDRDERLTAGPLWDYNLTLGVGFGGNRNVEGWQWEEREVASDWFRILGTDPDFLGLVSARWRRLREGPLSEAQLGARIDRLTAPLTAAAARDFERWPVAAVSQGLFQLPPAPSWEGQLGALREWLLERVEWLDSQL